MEVEDTGGISDCKAYSQVGNSDKKSPLTIARIPQGMLIVDHFCEGLDISAFHGKLRLSYLALALFEVQTKDKGPFKNNTRNYFSFHVLFCFITLIMLMYSPFTLQLWFICVYMHKWEIQAQNLPQKLKQEGRWQSFIPSVFHLISYSYQNCCFGNQWFLIVLCKLETRKLLFCECSAGQHICNTYLYIRKLKESEITEKLSAYIS